MLYVVKKLSFGSFVLNFLGPFSHTVISDLIPCKGVKRSFAVFSKMIMETPAENI